MSHHHQANNLHDCPSKQRGAALMIMLVILVMGAATFLVSSLSTSALKNARQETTSAALAQAKEALIGYAITYSDDPAHSNSVDGYLPCPDQGQNATQDGTANSPCGLKNVSAIGKLPWKTLGIPALRDGSGECLWYAVSGTYKNNPPTGLMNWDNTGLLNVSDANGGNVSDIVAVVFAPGATLSGQGRTPSGNTPVCGGNYTASNYLDSDGTHNNAVVSGSANAISSFFSGPSSQINDQFIYITRQDIWNAMLKRSDFMTTLTNMTQQVALCIAYFGKNNNTLSNKSLPWPAPLSLADYVTNTNYNDKDGLLAGRIPYKVNTARGQTGNSIPSLYYLLKSDGNNCPAGWVGIYPWWDNWKDHLFYAIGQEFKPDIVPTNSCGNCLNVNGTGKYAAVIMFAGKKLSGQTRADKSVVADYLEGLNASNLTAASGVEDYQTATTSSTFNDILYCIKEDLTVIPCP